MEISLRESKLTFVKAGAGFFKKLLKPNIQSWNFIKSVLQVIINQKFFTAS